MKCGGILDSGHIALQLAVVFDLLGKELVQRAMSKTPSRMRVGVWPLGAANWTFEAGGPQIARNNSPDAF